jgi:hypothetical protein
MPPKNPAKPQTSTKTKKPYKNFSVTKKQMSALLDRDSLYYAPSVSAISLLKGIDKAISDKNMEKAEKLINRLRKTYSSLKSVKFDLKASETKAPKKQQGDNQAEHRKEKPTGEKQDVDSATLHKSRLDDKKKKTSKPKREPEFTELDYPGKKAKSLSGSIASQLTDYDEGKKPTGEMNAPVSAFSSKKVSDLSGDLSSPPDTRSFRKVSGPDGLKQGIRVYKTPFGNVTVDSTDEGMWGKGKTSEDAANFKKGGTAKKKKAVSKYGAKTMKFTNRGGMYKVKR